MGLIQKDALRTALISYLGIGLGYINKGVLFIIILSTEQIGLVNLLFSLGTLFAQFSNFGLTFSVWKFFPFLKDTERKNRGFFVYMLFVACIGILLFCLIAIFFRSQIEQLFLEKSPLFIDFYFWFERVEKRVNLVIKPLTTSKNFTLRISGNRFIEGITNHQ